MVGFAICFLSALRCVDTERTRDNLAIAFDEFSRLPPGEHERRIFCSAAHLLMAQQEYTKGLR